MRVRDDDDVQRGEPARRPGVSPLRATARDSCPGEPLKTLHEGTFHGRRATARRHRGLTLVDAAYEPNHRLPLHAHERPFFSLLLRGTFSEKLERGGRECVPTSLVFYPAHEPHAEAFGPEGGRAFNVELGPGWTHRMEELELDPGGGSRGIRAQRINGLATRLYRDFLEDGDASKLALEELVLEMLAELVRLEGLGRESAPPAWLERVREILHDRWDEVVSMTELAEEAGVHPVHLARVFKAHHGCTVGGWIRRVRIQHACRRLAHDDTPLSALALQIGFADQAHFTRRFKEVTGVTPGRYRRLLTG